MFSFVLVLVVVCAFSRFSLSLHSLISNLLYSLLSLLSYVLYCSFCSPLLPLPLSIVYLPLFLPLSILSPSLVRSLSPWLLLAFSHPLVCLFCGFSSWQPFFSDCSISILISRSSPSLSLPPLSLTNSFRLFTILLLTSITFALDHSRSRSISHALSLCKSMFVRGLVVELFTHPHIHTLYHGQIPRCTLTLRLARPFPCLGHAWCLVDSSHVFPSL